VKEGHRHYNQPAPQFSQFFPAVAGSHSTTEQGGSPLSKPKCRILCVDDHFDTSEMLQVLLSDEDYEVQTAASIEEARQLATASEFDLYVLDKRLPDGTGLELCEILNQLSPTIPCIFYTGDAYEIHRHEAMAAGATAYVAKPDIDRLISTVHNLLSEKECAAEAGK
jgi:two-component system response regulator PilR (NtrC family)